jgi:hypothetical protein
LGPEGFFSTMISSTLRIFTKCNAYFWIGNSYG